MELRRYWEIIRRYLWLIVALPLLALLFSLLTYNPQPLMSAYDLQYSMAFTPTYSDQMVTDPALSAVQATEYMADDLTETLQGTVFFDQVAERLPQSVIDDLKTDDDMSNGEALKGTIVPERVQKTHRLLTLSFETPNESDTLQLVEAVKATISDDLTPWLDELWAVSPVRMELVSEVGPYENQEGLSPIVEIAVRMFVALVAAVALAFVLDYLNNSDRRRINAPHTGTQNESS